MQLAQPSAQLLAHPRIERSKRLVQEEHPGLRGERARQRHPLPLATGELVRVAPREPGELHQGEQLLHPLLHLGAWPIADPEGEGHILPHRHVPEQGVVLEHEAHVPLPRTPAQELLATVADLPLVRYLQPGQDAQERGLSAARWTEQRGELAVGQGQVHVAQHRLHPERLAHVRYLDGHLGLHPSSSRCCRRRAHLFATSVTTASKKRSEATANEARKEYSL